MTARFAADNRGGESALRVQPRERWLSLAVCVFLGLCVWAVFGQTLHHDFVNYDDDEYVYENPAITHGLSLHGVEWAFTHPHQKNWHPVTTLSHMLDCELYGLKPGGHHLTSVLLHAATGMLLFGVLWQMTGALWRSALVAAVFAIHPLRVESVAWVAERKDVLSGLFFMLTLWAYARYAQRRAAVSGEQQSLLRSPAYWLSLFFCTLGLMSKPMLVTVPFVLLLLDFWPLNRISDVRLLASGSRRLLWEKIPFLVLSAGSCVATMLAQQGAIQSVQSIGLVARFTNAVMAYAVYLWQMVCPVDLAVFYLHPGNTVPVWPVIVSVVVLVLISVAVLGWGKERRYGLVGWMWYLVMLVPVIGLVQVGNQAHADRYTYLPQIGLYILIVWGLADVCDKWRYGRPVLGVTALGMLAGLLALARGQAAYWKNSLTLWPHTLASTSGNYIADFNLGAALSQQGKVEEAIGYFQQGLEFKPDDAKAHYNLANALMSQGKLEAAIGHWKMALQLKPDYAEANDNLGLALQNKGKLDEAIARYRHGLQSKPEDAVAHNNLGSALQSQGKLKEAIEHYRQALQLDPDYAEAHVNLGLALQTQGNLDEAVGHWQRALQLNPKDAKAHNYLGLAFSQQGKLELAIEHYEQGLRFNPDDAKAHFDLANTLQKLGDIGEAMKHWQRALEIEPDYVQAHGNLGNALAGQGKMAEAMEHWRTALQLKPDYAPAHCNLGAALQDQGKLTEAKEHYRKALSLAEAQNNAALAECVRGNLKDLEAAADKTANP